MMIFQNTYEDSLRAEAYDELAFGGTYRLAFDCLPKLLSEQVTGTRALDFGCGTGRSSRFLQQLGFEVVGVDISPEMISLARTRDPRGKYYLIEDGDFSPVETNRFNLILCAFPFDNIPTRKHKVHLLTLLGSLLAPEGRIVNIVSTPEIYIHEWVTFTTRDYPENHHAVCGDIVRIITKEYSDERPVEDILWTDEDYQSVYRAAGLSQILNSTPLATGNEGIDWVNETRIAPWRIYVVEREGSN